MKAIGYNIIVKPIHEETEEKIGSLYVPGNVSSVILKGEIISIGDKVFTSSTGTPLDWEFDVHDKVLFLNTRSLSVQHNGEAHHVIQLSDIILREN